MNGVLIIDKPAGLTSHDVVARCRRILKTKKIGHTGTLDPFATGVMVILVGKATRIAQFLDKDEKEYEAVVRFGFETTTGDLMGLERGRVEEGKGGMGEQEKGREGERESGSGPTPETARLASAIKALTGTIEQTPPMYSAKKVGGKKLYELARRGVEVERKAVTVTISELELLESSDLPETDRRLRVVSSAGTYVRTLAEDIARHAGSRAHLAALRRTRAGKFGIELAVTLEELETLVDDERNSTAMIPMDEALEHLPVVRLNSDRAEKTRNGLSSRIESDVIEDGSAMRMQDESGGLIAIGTFDAVTREVKPRIVLV